MRIFSFAAMAVDLGVTGGAVAGVDAIGDIVGDLIGRIRVVFKRR